MDRVDVKTKAAAEKAISEGKAIRIVGGKFALAIADLSGVDIQIAATAQIEVELTNVIGSVAQEDMRTSSVVARGSSSVVAWESSRVEAWGSSSVVAWGYSMLHQRSSVTAKASATVCVNLWNGAKCEGGRQQIVALKTPQDWCDYYGVRVENGIAYVYKGVEANYHSPRGGDYTPGTIPRCADWDGGKAECGGGFHFSPTPRYTHEFIREPAHYLLCPVSLDEMAVHFGGDYPQKCKAAGCALPVVEVDIDGNVIGEKVEA